jgi:hypothetical protein
MSRNSISFRPLTITLLSALAATVTAILAVMPPVHAASDPVIVPATLGGDFKTPLDSTPSPDGRTIYFTADDKAVKPTAYSRWLRRAGKRRHCS